MTQKCDASQILIWWCCLDNCIKSENFLSLVRCILFEYIMKMMQQLYFNHKRFGHRKHLEKNSTRILSWIMDYETMENVTL